MSSTIIHVGVKISYMDNSYSFTAYIMILTILKFLYSIKFIWQLFSFTHNETLRKDVYDVQNGKSTIKAWNYIYFYIKKGQPQIFLRLSFFIYKICFYCLVNNIYHSPILYTLLPTVTVSKFVQPSNTL